MSIFNAPKGSSFVDGYIEDIPKYVSCQLEVTMKYNNSNQGYLSPNGLVRALEVGQEYNITLT